MCGRPLRRATAAAGNSAIVAIVQFRFDSDMANFHNFAQTARAGLGPSGCGSGNLAWFAVDQQGEPCSRPSTRQSPRGF